MHLVEQRPIDNAQVNYSPPSAASLSKLAQWSEAFAPLFNGRHRPSFTTHERAAINSLKLIELMDYVLFSFNFSATGVEFEFDTFFIQLREIIELGKEIVVDEELSRGQRGGDREERSMGHIAPSFTSEIRLIAPLFVVATNCRDRILRRETIKLLLSRPRRECLWDSIFCAEVAELIMEIEEKGMSPYDPWSQSVEEKIVRRVTIKEMVFDLQSRTGRLKYRIGGIGSEIVETAISW